MWIMVHISTQSLLEDSAVHMEEDRNSCVKNEERSSTPDSSLTSTQLTNEVKVTFMVLESYSYSCPLIRHWTGVEEEEEVVSEAIRAAYKQF